MTKAPRESRIPDDPRVTTFAALTKEESAAGLYRDPSRIAVVFTSRFARLFASSE